MRCTVPGSEAHVRQQSPAALPSTALVQLYSSLQTDVDNGRQEKMFLQLSTSLLLLAALAPAHAVVTPGTMSAITPVEIVVTPGYEPAPPCLMGQACRHTYSRSYMNNQVFCCPNGQGMSVNSNGFTTHCTCGSNSFVSNANFVNGQHMGRVMRLNMQRFQAEMAAFNRRMAQLGQNLANMFRGGFW
ncbi:uncharacterized protein LOC124253308 [Haliotis rubra]|uniref:uncharacterized protein LOC124253308 n=1 Tax=Haliotis rubra TaxID=36100 RepID=UPI001EE4F94B|nr:uncharacterized protein LOC124253308 [Haliotis rubra]